MLNKIKIKFNHNFDIKKQFKINALTKKNKNLNLYIVKTFLLNLFLICIIYYYYDSNSNLSFIKEQYEANNEKISKLDSEIKSNKKKLKEFNEKIISINKIFVKDKDEFGLYKLMEHLDKDAKIFNFKYTTNQKQSNLTKSYFFYDFKFEIPYNSYQAMQRIINTIEGSYHNTFVDAKFEKNKFVLNYKFYGKREVELNAKTKRK